MPFSIDVKTALHRNKPVLKLIFPYHADLVKIIRSLPGVLWSRTMNCWYLPSSDASMASLRGIEGVTIIEEPGNSIFQLTNEADSRDDQPKLSNNPVCQGAH